MTENHIKPSGGKEQNMAAGGKERIALIGPGQLGRQVYRRMDGDRLVIGIDEADCIRFGTTEAPPELGYSWNVQDASQCGIVAITLHPDVCGQTLETICPLLKDGTVVLVFATKYTIPQEMKDQFPKLSLVESKLIGSAVGMDHGLPGTIILSCRDASLTARIRAAFPGLDMQEGDWEKVPLINNLGTAAAIRAAFLLEQEYVSNGIPEEMAKAAMKCLVPGALISYAAGTLGKFGLDVLDELKKEMQNG